MIIKPEISLFRDGMYNNALEKIIENIFEFPTPGGQIGAVVVLTVCVIYLLFLMIRIKNIELE